MGYDQTTDTYTLDADLWIGDEQSAGTFFQTGEENHSHVTIIVKGTVWVRPARGSVARSDGVPSILSRLTLGDPGEDGIRATLKIDWDTPGEHGVYVGCRAPGKRPVNRGALHVFNSTLTAGKLLRCRRKVNAAMSGEPMKGRDFSLPFREEY